MYKSLRDIPNPYNPTEEVKNEKLFVGRDREINKISSAIDDYISSGIKKNFIITGGKSIGKSSLLNIIKKRLSDKKLLPVSFIINKNKIISPLVFFKELVDSVLESGSNADFLNIKSDDDKFTQKEIWESLTNYGEHESNKGDRELYLAEIYALALKNNRFDLPLSEVNLIKDFKFLVISAIKFEYKGIVILIDDFQLLSENDSIIQLLQRLMEEVDGLLFIMAGNQLLNSDSFDKIIRRSETINLTFFQPHQIQDFIFKPLMYYGFTRDEINEVLDKDSFSFFFRKKEHNPYYINLILYYSFEKYKKNYNEKIRLDYEITSEVINQLKLNSPYHEKIAAQLTASSREQLEALTRLFPFQNINLNEIVLIQLAFEKLTEENYNRILKLILSDICLITPMNLFEFDLPDGITLKTLQQEETISRNLAAEIKYKFIGDNIDELYMSHFIQSSLNEDLILDTQLSSIDHLSFKLQNFILDRLNNLIELSDKDFTIGKITLAEDASELELNSKSLSEKVEALEKTSEKKDISQNEYEMVNSSTKDTVLNAVSIFSQIFNNSNGLYYSFVKVKIRHKVFNYENIFFFSTPIQDYTPIYPMDSIISDSFNDYNIEILDSIVLKIKPQIIIFLQSIDTLEMQARLLRSLVNNNFELTISILEIQKNFNDNKNIAINNIGFAYMCDEQYEIAYKHFEKVIQKEDVTYCNLAYLEYRRDGKQIQIEQYLKKAEKQLKLKTGENTYLAIHQILLPLNLRKTQPKNFDLAYDVSADLIIQGNKALLASFNKQNHGFKLLNKAKLYSELDNFYKRRYEYFLHLNLGNITKAKDLLGDIEGKKFETIFYQQIEEQIRLDRNIIFQSI